MTDDTNDDLDIVDEPCPITRRQEAMAQMQHNRNQELLDDQRAAARVARNREKFIKLGLWRGK